MTVAELIAILTSLPGEAEVVCPNGEMSDEFVPLADGDVRIVALRPTEGYPEIFEVSENGPEQKVAIG